jgi:sugar lactone lactonase YvrE
LSIATLALLVRTILGGPGKPYKNLSTLPELNESALELVVDLMEPPGNIAVSSDNRVFFNFHSEARPEKIKVAELKHGLVVPFPNEAAQKNLFDTVFSVRIDRQNRLWTLDHGLNGLRQARLLAFDLTTNEIVHDYAFPASIAGLGSFLNDLQVDAKGEKIYLADTSVFARKPAIIVYDVKNKQAKRVLENHQSVSAEDLLIETAQGKMTFFGGLFALKPALDSIVLDKNDEWLYYGAMAGSRLYRIQTKNLNSLKSNAEIENSVEDFSEKPQSDGLSIDMNGTIYLTAIEHGSIMSLDANKKLVTLVQSKKIRWPDGLSFGNDGWLYLTDSALPDAMLRTKAHIQGSRPYQIYRIRLTNQGIPGH